MAANGSEWATNFAPITVVVACFSMYPLFVKDRLHLAYGASVLLFVAIVHLVKSGEAPNGDSNSGDGGGKGRRRGSNRSAVRSGHQQDSSTLDWVGHLYKNVMVAAMIFIHLLMAFVTPPSRYPDLWTVACTTLSCGYFVLVFIMSNVSQFWNTRTALGRRQ